MQRKIFWIVFALLGLFDFETAVKGKNGWVCMVERGWEMFDWPEFWPKIRAANYLNPQTARSMLPLVYKRTELLLAGHSKVEIIAAIKAAFEKKELPPVRAGSRVLHDVKVVLSD